MPSEISGQGHQAHPVEPVADVERREVHVGVPGELQGHLAGVGARARDHPHHVVDHPDRVLDRPGDQALDLDRRGEKERSFSDDGDIAWQIFAGVDYELTDAWILQGEVRYSFLDDVTLDEESGSGRLSGLDYDPVTFQLGVVYRF